MKYQEMLKDSRWINLAEALKEKANWTCSLCKSIDKPLHVHHKKYVSGRKPWQYHPDLLQVICKDCHNEIHEKKICKECKKKVKHIENLKYLQDIGCDSIIWIYGCVKCCENCNLLPQKYKDIFEKTIDYNSLIRFYEGDIAIRVLTIFPCIDKDNEFKFLNKFNEHKKHIIKEVMKIL